MLQERVLFKKIKIDKEPTVASSCRLISTLTLNSDSVISFWALRSCNIKSGDQIAEDLESTEIFQIWFEPKLTKKHLMDTVFKEQQLTSFEEIS